MAPTQTNVVQHKSIILTVITTTNATAKIPIFKNNIWLHKLWQPCSRAARKWRENEEVRRKLRENDKMERDWLSTFPHSLSISSLFLHFLPLFPFPTSKCITFCCKMLNTALLSPMSQKSQHTRYEEIILGRTCCEEAPQFVPACFGKKNITLGSVKPPAMFPLNILQEKKRCALLQEIAQQQLTLIVW